MHTVMQPGCLTLGAAGASPSSGDAVGGRHATGDDTGAKSSSVAHAHSVATAAVRTS